VNEALTYNVSQGQNVFLVIKATDTGAAASFSVKLTQNRITPWPIVVVPPKNITNNVTN
jgi:hypothetical protein